MFGTANKIPELSQ